jgi:putative ABC transport system ATP-binding protein
MGSDAALLEESTMATIGRGLTHAPALRRGLGVTLVLAVFGTGTRVIVPILIQLTIDSGFEGGQVRMERVLMLCAAASVSVFATAMSMRAAIRRLGTRSEEALYDLRVRLFEHIHRLSVIHHNDEKRGALVARVTGDIEALSQFFSWGALSWLLQGSLMVVVGLVMLAYDWLLALVAFAISLPLFWALRRVQARLARAYMSAREANADALGRSAEFVAGAETLAAYDARDDARQQLEQVVERRYAKQIRAGVLGAFLFPIGEVFAVFTISGVVVVGVLRGPGSGLTLGAMVGFVFLTYRFLEPISEFTEILDQTQAAAAGLRRILQVLDIPAGPPEPDHPVPLPTTALDIMLRDVWFAYPPLSGGVDSAFVVESSFVLRGVTLSIAAGQHVAVVGSTGSGKSTLGRIVARLVDPSSGMVTCGGVALPNVANADLRQRLTFVPQEPFLFDGTVTSNLLFARSDATRAECEAIIEDLGLQDWIASLPQGLDTPVGERGGEMSAGERQLVALIRAALANPEILVLDEATSSVDPIFELQMSRAFERLSTGRTTIAIAHRLSTAQRADRVLVMEEGQVVEDGSHDQLVADGQRYAELYEAWVSATSSR